MGITDISLDHYQPGGLKCCWRVENKEGSSGLGYSGRMTARECYLYLCAMIYMQEKEYPKHESIMAERECCAKIADKYACMGDGYDYREGMAEAGENIASEIRSREHEKTQI